MKRILIYGKRSYIGDNIRIYLLDKKKYDVITVDAREIKPANIDYTNIDVVIDVVGIAHIRIKNDMEDSFYAINRDLAIELCSEAKKHNVKQFIYLSSMNVYGDTTKKIESRRQENPINFYGKSKLEADIAIQAMNDKNFKVVSIRPPVVYGNGCKGNFNLLIRISKLLFLVPNYLNKKSIIYIDHLCEFIKQIIDNEEKGVFHPQNKEIVTTIDIISSLRMYNRQKTFKVDGFNWLVKLFSKFNHKIFKAFADDYYDIKLSNYKDNSYCTSNFSETIKKTLCDR